jgi:hypothetical protein
MSLELSDTDKTIFSLCISVFVAAKGDEHLGDPVLLQKAINELKAYVMEHSDKGKIIKEISQAMCGKDEFPGDLVQYVKNEIAGRNEAEAELSNIDELLDRRDALDSEPTRYDKILKAINTAKRADQAEAKVKELEDQLNRETISVNELSLANQDLEAKVKELVKELGVLKTESETRIKELEVELKDQYEKMFVPEAKRVKELEAKLLIFKNLATYWENKCKELEGVVK